jgi:hypothetical protein
VRCGPTEEQTTRTDHNQKGQDADPCARWACKRSCRLINVLHPGHFHQQRTIEIAMKYALIAACVAAFAAASGFACSQGVDERREAPVAAPKVSEGPDALRWSNTTQTSQPAVPSARAPETAGRSSSRDAASSAQEELRSAAEARRVRDAVRRTLDRARELSRAESE